MSDITQAQPEPVLTDERRYFCAYRHKHLEWALMSETYTTPGEATKKWQNSVFNKSDNYEMMLLSAEFPVMEANPNERPDQDP
jgi:hypothetical protein